MENTVMIWQDEDCLLAGYPPPMKRRDTLILPFDRSVWLFSFLIMICSIIFVFVYIWIAGPRAELKYGQAFTYLWATVFQEPAQTLDRVQSNGFRIFLVIFTATFFILSTSYSGNLVSFLSIPPKRDILHSLEDVANSPQYAIQLEFMQYLSEFNTNPHKQIIAGKTQGVFDIGEHIPKVRELEAVLFGSKDYLKYLIKIDEEE